MAFEDQKQKQAESTHKIFFQLRYITTDFLFGDRQISISDPNNKMCFALRKRVAGDADRPELDETDGFATVTFERKMSERLYEEISSSGRFSIKKGGVGEIRDEMYEFMLRVIGLIRWRGNLTGRHHPIRMGLSDGFRWSFEGQEWRYFSPQSASATVRIIVQGIWNPEADQFLTAEAFGDLDEPIGHVLLREAWTNRNDNPRSCIVLAVAAAEVGFKQFAATVLPDTAWILENIQSPPLIRMLSDFPWAKLKIRIGGEPLKPPASVVDELTKAVSLRNKIVHGHSSDLTARTTHSITIAVRDLLHFLDAAQGQGWALSYLSVEARKDFPQIKSWPFQVAPLEWSSLRA